jgi:hypothetical protein
MSRRFDNIYNYEYLNNSIDAICWTMFAIMITFDRNINYNNFDADFITFFNQKYTIPIEEFNYYPRINRNNITYIQRIESIRMSTKNIAKKSSEIALLTTNILYKDLLYLEINSIYIARFLKSNIRDIFDDDRIPYNIRQLKRIKSNLHISKYLEKKRLYDDLLNTSYNLHTVSNKINNDYYINSSINKLRVCIDNINIIKGNIFNNINSIYDILPLDALEYIESELLDIINRLHIAENNLIISNTGNINNPFVNVLQISNANNQIKLIKINYIYYKINSINASIRSWQEFDRTNNIEHFRFRYRYIFNTFVFDNRSLFNNTLRFNEDVNNLVQDIINGTSNIMEHINRCIIYGAERNLFNTDSINKILITLYESYKCLKKILDIDEINVNNNFSGELV